MRLLAVLNDVFIADARYLIRRPRLQRRWVEYTVWSHSDETRCICRFTYKRWNEVKIILFGRSCIMNNGN